MNIHTVEISYLLGPDLVRQLCRSQQWFRFQRPIQRNRGWADITEFVSATETDAPNHSSCLESDFYPVGGIQQVTLLRNPSRRGYFFLVVVINLESLYRNDMTVESFQCTEERIQRCCESFRTVMANFSDITFRPLLEWSTRRVDYAVDARYPGLAPLYISLVQRGRIPRGMEQRNQYTGSYYLELPNDDVTVNFYDKEDQLLNDRYINNNDRLVREAHGLIRFEVQCQGRKLDHIRDIVQRMGLPHYGMQLRTFLNAEVANSVVQDYYSRTVGYLDYYDLPWAIQQLHSQPGRQDMKQRIQQFLHQIDQAGSVTAGVGAYNQGIMPDGSPALISGPASSLQNLLNVYLPRFGVNPVTIPTEYHQNHLPNPMPVELRLDCRRG